MHFSIEVKIRDNIFLQKFKVKETRSIVLYSDPKNILVASKGVEDAWFSIISRLLEQYLQRWKISRDITLALALQ